MHANATIDTPAINPTTENSRQGRSARHKVLIVGGGNAGISVAARLAHSGVSDVAVIEPSENHFYQPLWTLVGGGVVNKDKSLRAQASVIPKGVKWIQDVASEFDPEGNRVLLEGGDQVEYDFLVVACGIELHWGAIKGLAGAVGRDGVCSNYAYDTLDYTWETINSFKGGTALFTMPAPPIKCAGAPQKIAYLADEAFRKSGVREKSEIIYAANTPGIFAVPEYAKTLNEVIARKGIDARFQHALVELRPESREAVFKDQANDSAEVVINYDMIHVTPPQRAPRVVRESPLADDAGWLSVDKESLRSDKFSNVFAIGDASSLPTSKTGAAIRKQAPVLAANLLAAIDQRVPDASYDGYTACPLVTGYGKLVMAEFDYDLNLAQTFPVDQTKERWSMYQVKKNLLPRLYWNRILTGKA